MRIVDRRDVGAEPTIQVGRREYRRRDGTVKACRTWCAKWCHRGRPEVRSLRTRDEAVAIERAARLRVQLLSGEQATVVREFGFEKLRERYIEYQRHRDHAPRTIQKYDLVLRQLSKWATDAGLRDISRFSEGSFWSFHRQMVDDGFSDKTRYDRLIVVKQAFKWAARTKLISENPISGADLIPKPCPTPQPCFGPEQVARLLDAATGQMKAIFHLMAYAGLRFGEVRDLQWDDVQWDQGRIGFLLIRRGGSNGTTKTRRHRRVPIHPRLREVLLELPRTGDRLFADPASTRGVLLDRKLLFRLKDLCARCELPNPRQYKLHTFRHAFASMCARTNIAYKYALTWLGHRSSDILDLYYHMFDPAAEEAIRTIEYGASSHA